MSYVVTMTLVVDAGGANDAREATESHFQACMHPTQADSALLDLRVTQPAATDLLPDGARVRVELLVDRNYIDEVYNEVIRVIDQVSPPGDPDPWLRTHFFRSICLAPAVPDDYQRGYVWQVYEPSDLATAVNDATDQEHEVEALSRPGVF